MRTVEQLKFPLEGHQLVEVTVIARCSCGQSYEASTESGAFDLFVDHDHRGEALTQAR